jgi:CRISPR/Cas system-associated exonuclease Cas4 (RecB family)
MRQLSKSKIIAYRQCPKRLWLEVHRPELRDDTGSEVAFAIGNQVGDIARSIYDPEEKGHLIEIDQVGWPEAFLTSAKWLCKETTPIFEAALRIPGALALADVMMPIEEFDHPHWHMIEVKSSTSVKDYHHDDIAVQAFIARESGIPIDKVSLAHVDNSFIYPGERNYQGLLKEIDLTSEVTARAGEVAEWLNEAQAIAAQNEEPEIEPGPQCYAPFTCGFCTHCIPEEEPREYPLTSFSHLRTAKREALEAEGYLNVQDVPTEQLSAINHRIQEQTIKGEAYFDQEGAASDLAQYPGEPRFLDFETIAFAVPIWIGTRPYQQLPFQFSLHHRDSAGHVQHHEILDISGNDPRRTMAEALIRTCDTEGPIFAYNASFERRVIQQLATQFPEHSDQLTAITNRIADLLPIARNRYYHPSQHGSWSLKAVLPAICPDLSYGDLNEIQDGGLAQQAYLEACAQENSATHREEIRGQLLAYCKLDTYALVRIWEFFRAATNDKG